MTDLLNQLQLILQTTLALSVGYASINILPQIKSMLSKKPIDPLDWLSLKIGTNDKPVLVSADNGYTYRLPVGLSVDDVIAKQKKIETALQNKVEIRQNEDYSLTIKPVTDKYKDVYKIDLKAELLDGMKFRIGKKLDGSDMILDMTGSECHTLVCGSTGSGKSVFLNILVSQLILKQVELHIVDFKRVEYTLYKHYSNVKGIAYTHEQAESTLCHVKKMMDNRYNVLEREGCKNYKDMNAKYPDAQMTPCVLLIDEFSVIKPKSKTYNYDTYDHLFDLLARARACNIIVIIATQRPDSKVISGDLKCNIKNTVVFKCENEVDSEVALSQKGNYSAFKIKESGVGLLKTRGEIKEFKSYYLSDEEIVTQLKNTLKRKKPIQPKKVTP